MEHITENFYYNYGLAQKVYGGWIFQVNTFEKDNIGYDCFYFYGNYRVWIENFDKAVEGLKFKVLADKYENSFYYRMYEELVEESEEENEEENEEEE